MNDEERNLYKFESKWRDKKLDELHQYIAYKRLQEAEKNKPRDYTRILFIIANSWGGELRTGVIKMINIAMSNHDVAAENDEAVSTQVYDTRLEYQGSVSYGDNFWCYFNKIIRKEKYDE